MFCKCSRSQTKKAQEQHIIQIQKQRKNIYILTHTPKNKNGTQLYGSIKIRDDETSSNTSLEIEELIQSCIRRRGLGKAKHKITQIFIGQSNTDLSIYV